MNFRIAKITLTLIISLACGSFHFAAAQTSATNVVAFWSFENEFDFSDPTLPDGVPNTLDFPAEAGDGAATANLQAFLGNAGNLDADGGGGFVSYTSPVSGITYDPTRTIKWDDLRGTGDDFGIAGEGAFFTVDRNDGAGAVPMEDFGNDALIYLTLDGTGFSDFEVRFDIEGTPGLDPADPTASDLPETFDIFYRTTGPGGVWFREIAQNNIPLSFMDLTPADPDNQFADSGFHSLNSALDNQSQIEIIINDFAEFGNDELEIDNIEIVANVVPEPTTIGLILMGLAGALRLVRKKR